MSKTSDTTPMDKVVNYIKEGIDNQTFKHGDRLPSERKLALELGVSRPNVKQALQKLETYGIVKTYPQSGTVVSHFSKEQYDNMIHNSLEEEKFDFFDLVYVRVLLEIEVCRLAALNHTTEDIEHAEAALKAVETCKDSDDRVKKDFEFHQAIAQCGHNPVIASLLLIITPDIMKYYHKYRFCTVSERIVMTEHREYITYIKNGEASKIRELVLRHLRNQIETAEILSGKEMPHFKLENITQYL